MTITVTPMRLDWRPRHDPRSLLQYAAADRVDTAAPLAAVSLPHQLAPLQQHGEGACAPFATAHAINTLRLDRPVTTRPAPEPTSPGRVELVDGLPELLTEADALARYARAQRLDVYPDSVPGTSIIATMQAYAEAGDVGEYVWCAGTRDIAHTLQQLRRPVVVGVPWLDGMWSTDADGRVKVEGSGPGTGHALCVFAFDPEHPLHNGRPGFDWLNSQDGYGRGTGVGSISARDLAWLLAAHGEACAPGLPS